MQEFRAPGRCAGHKKLSHCDIRIVPADFSVTSLQIRVELMGNTEAVV